MAIQAIVLQSDEAICFRDAYINGLEKEILEKKRITQIDHLNTQVANSTGMAAWLRLQVSVVTLVPQW